MFEFVFEGALFALTYNGDRFVLFALLPRRKPRPDVGTAAIFQPSPSAATIIRTHYLTDGMGFLYVYRGSDSTTFFRAAQVRRSASLSVTRCALFSLASRRCRTRGASPRSRAQSTHRRKTETGTYWPRSRHGENRAPTSSQHQLLGQ